MTDNTTEEHVPNNTTEEQVADTTTGEQEADNRTEELGADNTTGKQVADNTTGEQVDVDHTGEQLDQLSGDYAKSDSASPEEPVGAATGNYAVSGKLAEVPNNSQPEADDFFD